METYYDVLGVPEDASTDDIEAAYRERLKTTHPDVSDDDDASDRTKLLIEARDVLTDDEERARYDRLGHEQYVETAGGPETTQTQSSDEDAGGWETADPDFDFSTSGTNGSQSSDTGSGDTTTGTGWSEASQEAWSWTEETGDTGTSTARDNQRAPRDSWSDSGQTGQTEATETASTAGQDADWRAWNTGGAFSVRNASGQGGYTVPTGQTLVVLCLTFLFYPLLLGSALFQGFPLFVNVVVGGCVLLVVAYLQSMPTVGIVVFGSWSLLTPVLFSAVGLPLFSPFGLTALGGTVFALGLSLLTKVVIRP